MDGVEACIVGCATWHGVTFCKVDKGISTRVLLLAAPMDPKHLCTFVMPIAGILLQLQKYNFFNKNKFIILLVHHKEAS